MLSEAPIVTPNFYIPPNPGVTVVPFNEIIAGWSREYMIAVLICSIALLIYVLMNNFVELKPQWKKDLDDYAIMPALFLFIVSVSYFTGFGGI